MRLGEIMAKYPRVRVGQRSDNARILDFLGGIPTDAGSIVFKFVRSPDYFRYLEYQGATSFVFLFLNDDGGLGGVGTFCLRTCYLDGVPTPTIYFADVRMSPRLSRRTRVEWRAWYADIVQHAHQIEEFNCPKFLYTLVMDGNQAPLRAFASGKSTVNYRALARLDTVNLIGRRPFSGWRRRQLAAIPGDVRRARPSDLEALRALLHASNKPKHLGFNFTLDPWARDGAAIDELQRRLETWDGLDIGSFWVAVDPTGKLQACVAPWSFDRGRRLRVERLPRSLRWLGRMMPALGRDSIDVGQELRITNLTHLEFSPELTTEARQAWFIRLLDAVWETPQARSSHLVSLADFDESAFGPALSRYVVQRSPATLYEVAHVAEQTTARPSEGPLRARTAFEIAIP